MNNMLTKDKAYYDDLQRFRKLHPKEFIRDDIELLQASFLEKIWEISNTKK